MRLEDFDYALPEHLIALRPARPRDAARLLMVPPEGSLQDRSMRDLPKVLGPKDLLVFNDTRVIPARLQGTRRRGSLEVRVLANLLRPLGGGAWTALMRPGKRLRVGDEILFSGAERPQDTLAARVEAKGEDGIVTLSFPLAGEAFDQVLARVGAPPLPPYIAAQRPGDARDLQDYQTIYARAGSSVAAPTAGLHFTRELFEEIRATGASVVFVTLHVGAGTFLPVKTERIEEHSMHSEFGEITPEAALRINAARQTGGRIVCVGTTSLRVLESAVGTDGRVQPYSANTELFIRPGFEFRAADLLLTNFHLPRSTLLMLVAAFSGLQTTRRAYEHAVRAGYRFYSYGDAGLWWRGSGA